MKSKKRVKESQQEESETRNKERRMKSLEMPDRLTFVSPGSLKLAPIASFPLKLERRAGAITEMEIC